MPETALTDPPVNCSLCPRLVDFRRDNQQAYPDYFNGAAPTFGADDSALLIVGLAPGLHGANRTGRPFTGDFAGDLLYATLDKFGFSRGRYGADPGDGLTLDNAAITNAVRCVPPQNKPIGAEINACRQFLENTIGAMKNLRAILCLGRVSHDATLAALSIRKKDAVFGHGARHAVPDSPLCVFDSYHCSRYNTNTGRLTAEMFEDVIGAIKRYIDDR